ncbi:MAG: hypothetical protein ABJD07_04495 [Gemmatimonadaceae bacterium]
MPNARRPALDARLGPVIALAIAVFAFLPIASWIPGGRDVPWYGSQLAVWLAATVLSIGFGALAAIASRYASWLWRDRLLDGVAARYDRNAWPIAIGLAVVAFALYAATASVFSRRPILIDEVVQLFHARIFLGGRLWLPASERPEFFSVLHVVDTGGKVYSQFPAGGPAALALGAAIGMPWIVNAFYGALAILAFVAFLRVAEPRPGVALGSALVFALAPFAVFMSGSHMNHVPLLLCLVAAMAALAGVTSSDTPRPWLALACGLALGLAATIRPVDALAFALPAGLWMLARALRDKRRWVDALPAAVGVIVPVVLLMWVNMRTTGAPFRFGYEVLWGKEHALGFHVAPWGIAHTPARGVELINLYFLRLQLYFLETPVPALIPFIAALALTRRFSALDRYLLASGGLIVGLYFAYWHDGFFLGPRFMYPLLPALALWTARALPLVRERIGRVELRGISAYRVLIFASVAAVVAGLVTRIPLRLSQYSHGLASMRWDVDSAATKDDVRHSLVLVRESWGAQLMSRLWALGVTRTQSELLYRHIDTCVLEVRVTSLEGGVTRGGAAYQVIAPLLRDSSKLRPSSFSPDTTERVLPDAVYPSKCEQRIDDDRAGTTLYALTLTGHEHDNVYARDLHERDQWLLDRYPGRSVYLLTPTVATGPWPKFFRVSRDSLERAWREGH